MKNKSIVTDEIVIEGQDYINTELETMLYKKNKWPYLLSLLGLAINCVYFVNLYSARDNSTFTWTMGISVLYNLVFMLTVFLCAENVKFYSKKFSYVLGIVGTLQLARILILPLKFFKNGAIDGGKFTLLTVILVLSAVCLIASCILGIISATKLENYRNSLEGKGE